ncbi:hypothetical protein [Acetobacter estunensis]|uniref:hypothetical protein n=1 Tax=Acetobacter estunensis TaxID=104097 RepID=UPI001C2DCD39|nr:hypothetical protein [Acetobacter estunensis]MBV1837952.1 hypothetical protein [Acetobacter estunensis]
MEYLNLFSNDFVYKVNPREPIRIEEKNTDGKGTCFFSSDHSAIFIKAKDHSPVIWSLENRKCAEAAFFTTENDNVLNLHIVEMKSSVGISCFIKVIDQWIGMYLSAMAVIGILLKNRPQNIFVYLAYNTSSINTPTTSSPIMLKPLVGGGFQKGLREWHSHRVSLPHGVTAQIIKKQRVLGDCDFGLVS